MKYIIYIITIGTFALISNQVVAEQTQFKQQILPIDCIYEVIDVGTQKLRYITPETCPIDPGPPVITEPPITEIPNTNPLSPNETAKNPIIYSFAFSSITVQPPNANDDAKEDSKENALIPQVAGVIERIIVNTDVVYILSILVAISWLFIALRTYLYHRRHEQ